MLPRNRGHFFRPAGTVRPPPVAFACLPEAALRLPFVEFWLRELALRLPYVEFWLRELALRLPYVEFWLRKMVLRLPYVDFWFRESAVRASLCFHREGFAAKTKQKGEKCHE